MSTYTAMTPEQSKEMHTKFLQRRIDACKDDVEFLTVEYLKAVSTNNIAEMEDCERALNLAKIVLANANATLHRYLAGKPFIYN